MEVAGVWAAAAPLEGVDPGEYGFVRATVHGFILNEIFYTVVFVLGFVPLINSLTSGKSNEVGDFRQKQRCG